MKRVLRTTMMALLVMILLVGMMAPAAMAASVYTEVSTPDIPITITMDTSPVSGEEVPATDTISVTVEALTTGSPAATKSQFVINCVGGEVKQGTGSFKVGPFNKPGIHKYHVTLGASNHEFALEDEAKHFIVIVSVTNKKDYSGLETTVAIHNAEIDDDGVLVMGTKCKKLEDENLYYPPLTITVNKRWASGGAFPVTVYLYEKIETDQDLNGDGVVDDKDGLNLVDQVILSGENSWSHVFTETPDGDKLDYRNEYVVVEENVPRYHESYSYNKDDAFNWIVTVTNTKSLYQTGQLNWPIPVLVCMGSMLMLAGVMMLRKKEEQTNE